MNLMVIYFLPQEKKAKPNVPSRLPSMPEIERWKRDVHLDLRVDGPHGPKFTDPLEWWKYNRFSFPVLASVARLVRILL